MPGFVKYEAGECGLVSPCSVNAMRLAEETLLVFVIISYDAIKQLRKADFRKGSVIVLLGSKNHRESGS
jgi:hypothetical protein